MNKVIYKPHLHSFINQDNFKITMHLEQVHQNRRLQTKVS
jgi:hypothetical protein